MAALAPGQPPDGGFQPDPNTPITWKDIAELAAGVASANVAAGAPVAMWTAKHATQLNGWGLVWNVIVGLVDQILLAGVDLITKLQGQDNPSFFDLMQGLLSDLLGVEFESGALRSAWQRGGSTAAIKAGGQKLMQTLATELSTTLPQPPGPGLSAAQGLLGYIMAFSVREANVETFLSLIPEEYRFLDGIREYGVNLARNLGLGRICRQALIPWLKFAIQDPMTHELNAQYMPTFLGATQAIKAHNRGMINDTIYAAEIAADGYTDARAAALTEETLEQVGNSDLYTMFRYGNLDEPGLNTLLKRRGMHPLDADRYLVASRLAEANSAVDEMLSLLQTQRLAGFIDDSTYQAAVEALPIAGERKDRSKAVITQHLGAPREALTVSQLQYSLKDGDLDEQTFLDRINARGYSPDDANLLLRYAQTHLKSLDKHLSIGELQTAYISGLIDLTEFGDYLTTSGYSQDEADVLTMLSLQKLDTDQAKQAVARYTWNKAVAKATKAGTEPPPMPAILATGLV